jgi:hypothetical protein
MSDVDCLESAERYDLRLVRKGGDMRKLFTVLATAIVLLAGSAIWKAEAAPMGGLGDLSPLTKGASPVETVACWCGPYRCACRRYWGPRPYWGPRVYWGPRAYWGPRYRWRY